MISVIVATLLMLVGTVMIIVCLILYITGYNNDALRVSGIIGLLLCCSCCICNTIGTCIVDSLHATHHATHLVGNQQAVYNNGTVEDNEGCAGDP